MRAAIIAVIVLGVVCPARADECDALTAKVVQATGAKFDRRTPSGAMVVLTHPLASRMTIQCYWFGSTRLTPSVSVSFGGAYPPDIFFDLVGITAHEAIGVPFDRVRSSAIQCHQAALRTKTEMGEISRKPLKVECQAYGRDQGLTSIDVFPLK